MPKKWSAVAYSCDDVGIAVWILGKAAWPLTSRVSFCKPLLGYFAVFSGVQMGAMYLTADGATQDEAIGQLPELPIPVGPNQYTPVTLLPLQPPNYEVHVRS